MLRTQLEASCVTHVQYHQPPETQYLPLFSNREVTSTMLLPLPTLEPRYVCPGETHAISRAVHLSRLAAFYPKCHECGHRQEIGQLPQPQFSDEATDDSSSQNRSLFTLEGIRGVYLNELNRHKAAEFATAFASLLWDALPLAGRSDLRDSKSKRPARRLGPVVVVGFDERPSSPDLVAGVATALRRMSCQVVDIGQTSVPCFRFAVAHMQAAGGVMITGHGCEPSWTGLDFVGKQGRPISAARPQSTARQSTADSARLMSLDDLLARNERGVGRPLRQAGTQRVFQASVPYLAGLWKHFHALRPLRVAIGCPVRRIRQTIDELFAQLPVTLHWFDVPQRRRDLLKEDDLDKERLRTAVAATSSDFGLLIDDDGANVAVVDELGEWLRQDSLFSLVAEPLLAESSQAAIVIENGAREKMQPLVAAMGARCLLGGWTQSELWQSLQHDAAVCGGGSSGRIWLRETFPTTDAILTLAKLLQALSRDDRPMSEAVKPVVPAA